MSNNTSLNTPLFVYHKAIAEGILEPDPAQAEAVQALDRLYHHYKARQSLWFWVRHWTSFTKKHIKGLYIYGSVGRGKSLLMDLFFDCLPPRKACRFHFFQFMDMIEARLALLRQTHPAGKGKKDLVFVLAKQLAKEMDILCFDEFQLRDIGDASLLTRLFFHLFACDVVVVITTNEPLSCLYQGQLHKERFLPFLELLREKNQILHLKAKQDYRLAQLKGRQVWHTPLTQETRTQMDRLFLALTHNAPLREKTYWVNQRKLIVRQQVLGVARFSFGDLCEGAMGAKDYLCLAQNFHTLFIDDIPVLTNETSNETLRFIYLIDVLYDHCVKLVASAASLPQELCQNHQLRPRYERTLSRLAHMQTLSYMELAHKA